MTCLILNVGGKKGVKILTMDRLIPSSKLGLHVQFFFIIKKCSLRAKQAFFIEGN